MAEFIDGGVKSSKIEAPTQSADPEPQQSLGDMSAQTLAQEMKKIATTETIPEAAEKKESPKPKVHLDIKPKESSKETPKPKMVDSKPKETAKETSKESPKPKESPKAQEPEDKPPSDIAAVVIKQKEGSTIKQKEIKNITQFTDNMVNE